MREFSLRLQGMAVAIAIFCVWLIIFVCLTAGHFPDNPHYPAVVHAQTTNSCDKSVAISVASGTTTVLVTSVPGSTTQVCGFVVSGDTLATTAQFKVGTGTTCGTGTVNLTGAMRLVAQGNIVYGDGSNIVMPGVYNTDLCITTATGAVTGILSYR